MSIKVMTRVWDESKQKGTNLVALLAIADHADDYGVCWPGLEKIAKKSRVQKRQVINIIEKLEASGEVIVIHRRGRHQSNRYFITIGLAPGEIKTTLDTHPELQFDDSDNDDKGAIDYTLSTRKGEENCTISHRKGAKDYTIYNEEKVQFPSEKVQSSTKKVQSGAEKGAIAIAPEPSIEPSGNYQEEPPTFPPSKPNGEGNLPQANVEQLADAVADLCKIDREIASNGKLQQVRATTVKLYQKQASLDDVKEFARWWRSFDWRGQKGSPPTPNQICDEWERFRGAKLNGSALSQLSDDKLKAYKALRAQEE